MIFQERYHSVFMAANATFTLPQGGLALGFFIANTAGTITVTKSNGTVVVSAFPVTAGMALRLPILVGYNAVITLAGGASGTLAYGT